MTSIFWLLEDDINVLKLEADLNFLLGTSGLASLSLVQLSPSLILFIMDFRVMFSFTFLLTFLTDLSEFLMASWPELSSEMLLVLLELSRKYSGLFLIHNMIILCRCCTSLLTVEGPL